MGRAERRRRQRAFRRADANRKVHRSNLRQRLQTLDLILAPPPQSQRRLSCDRWEWLHTKRVGIVEFLGLDHKTRRER